MLGLLERREVGHQRFQGLHGPLSSHSGRGAHDLRAVRGALGGLRQLDRGRLQPGELRELHLHHPRRHARGARLGPDCGGDLGQGQGEEQGNSEGRGRHQGAPRQGSLVDLHQVPHREPCLRLSDQGNFDDETVQVWLPLRVVRKVPGGSCGLWHLRLGLDGRNGEIEGCPRKEFVGENRQDQSADWRAQVGGCQRRWRQEFARMHPHLDRGRLCQGAGRRRPQCYRQRQVRRLPLEG
mmetsp:Transcript_129509/g.415148  ORF Transcript_129509/g.415148 Transcript_129509/m.415148 type:complete len:238 (+) Transcript_129509:787-1500(+)